MEVCSDLLLGRSQREGRGTEKMEAMSKYISERKRRESVKAKKQKKKRKESFGKLDTSAE